MSWLGERAALPDHTLLGSGRCSAFRCPDLLRGVGPAGPAPARLPSPHHLPVAGGATRAAGTLSKVWRLGEESRDRYGNEP